MISPYSHSPGQTTNRVGLPRTLFPTEPTNQPGESCLTGRTRKEKGPGSAFGPESVPLAAGSVSVVYWVPGPFSTPKAL